MEDIDTARLRPRLRGRARRGALSTCAEPGCPSVTRSTYCLDHARQRDRARGTTVERGYGGDHQATRARLDRLVQTGTVRCPCGELIRPGSPWDLGHTEDRRGYIGPMHARCNRQTRKAA